MRPFPAVLRALAANAHRAGLLIYAETPRILMYHSIVRRGNAYAKLYPGKYVEEHVFAESMRYVRDYCHPLSLSEFVRCAQVGLPYPRNAVVVTFDDGYANNCLRAAPILLKYGIPATFFITTGYVDGQVLLWPSVLDRYFACRDAMPRALHALGLPMRWTSQTAGAMRSTYSTALKTMSPEARQATIGDLLLAPDKEADTSDAIDALAWDQVGDLSRLPGMAIAPHTVSHPILAQLPDEEAEREIADSYQRIRKQGIPTAPYFAYPFGAPGDYTVREMRLAKKLGFRCALATHPGLVTKHADLFSLPRYEGKNELARFICHASGLQCILSRMTGLARCNKTSSGAYGGA